jgi:GT2 family glycosyltransferase
MNTELGRASVVIVNWNGWSDTLSTLEAIDAMTPRPSPIVVDNASTDGSVARIRDARPDVWLVENSVNGGYAGGNNLGVEHALEDGAELIWLLNNDARPRSDALVDPMRLFGIDSELGAVATNMEPQVYATATTDGQPILCPGCADGSHTANMLLGPTLIFRADVFRQQGLLDERYFHYCEEEDFITRIRAAGWKLALACRSWVDHDVGSTLQMWTPQASYYKLRNNLLFDRWNRDQSVLRSLFRHRALLWPLLAPRRSLMRLDARRLRAVVLAISDAARERVGQRDLGAEYWLQ